MEITFSISNDVFLCFKGDYESKKKAINLYRDGVNLLKKGTELTLDGEGQYCK